MRVLVHEELLKYVGNKIKEYRKLKGYTQLDLAKKLNIRNTTVSEYERGNINIDADSLFQIADVLDIKVDDLFPERVDDKSPIDDTRSLRVIKADAEHVALFKKLYERVSAMDASEREEYLNLLKFTIEYHDKRQNN